MQKKGIDFEKKKMLLLTKKNGIYIKIQQNVTFVKNKFIKKFAKDKNYQKIRDHCHYTGRYGGAAHSICISPVKCLLFFAMAQTIIIYLSFKKSAK